MKFEIIINFNNNTVYNSFSENIYVDKNEYIILTDISGLPLIKDILEIDDLTYNECLTFDETIKVDLFDKYDFFSINTFEFIDNNLNIKECNIYLASNFILIVCDDKHFLYKYVRNIIYNNHNLYTSSSYGMLLRANYLIFKHIIINQFENIEVIEDSILKLEDSIVYDVNEKHITEINAIREITRAVVKNIRPLLYIGDRMTKENLRFLRKTKYKNYEIDTLNGIDFSIDKLYSFAISTRELADKLLDIYSSKITEKTNNAITKLTILTAISAPLTIITGIYGMNFEFMPELSWQLGYPTVLLVMILIIVIVLIIFKIKKIL